MPLGLAQRMRTRVLAFMSLVFNLEGPIPILNNNFFKKNMGTTFYFSFEAPLVHDCLCNFNCTVRNENLSKGIQRPKMNILFKSSFVLVGVGLKSLLGNQNQASAIAASCTTMILLTT